MNERVRTLAESDAFLLAPVAYSILDPDGRQLAANPAFHSLFRTDRPGLRAEEITHEPDRELTASYLADLLSGKATASSSRSATSEATAPPSGAASPPRPCATPTGSPSS